MPTIDAKILAVMKMPPAEREAVLLAAWPVAGDGERPWLLRALLDAAAAEEQTPRKGLLTRGRPDLERASRLRRAVIGAWPGLAEGEKQAIGQRLGNGLGKSLIEVGGSDRARDRVAAVRAAADVALGRVSGGPVGDAHALLGVLAGDPDPMVSQAVFDVLAALIDRDPRGAQAEGLDRGLACAAGRFGEHRHTGVLRAVALASAGSPGPVLRAWLGAAEEPGHLALRSAARKLDEATRRRHAMAWLGVPALAGVAADTIDACDGFDAEERGRLLRLGHLLGFRGRGRAIARIRKPERLLEMPESQMRALDGEARRGWLRWCEASALRADRRLALLASRVRDQEASVRLLAARQIASLPGTPTADAALFDLALDADPHVAAEAASALARVESPRRRAALAPMLETLARSPHEAVRLAAAEVGRGRAADGPKGVVERARRVLGLGGGARGEEKLRAIEAVERAGAGALAEIEPQLLDAAATLDERLAAKAVLALGRVATPSARSAVTDGLAHRDARVRANAAEGLTRAAAVSGESIDLSAFAAAEHPQRLRANAVRHEWRRLGRAEGVRAAVGAMLADRRPEHRASGLWAAARTGDRQLLGPVAELAARDADARVRARAEITVRRLLPPAGVTP
ncbi:MAG: HEAT repeat domain-containing protein [Phycisphaerales bacterium]|nr:HEAT repeat domain-containing protein [Phycisphaerales bacterium]